MSGIVLIRHGSCAHLGRTLAGRMPGLHLDALGRAQAEALAERLSDTALAAVYTSPIERARETAEPLAAALGVEPIIAEGLTEIDFGEWTGCGFDALEGRPAWTEWNARRGTARAPGGEAMADVLARALETVAEMRAAHPGRWIAAVSHCDVIRGLLAHFAGMPLDRMLRLEVAPASISIVELGDDHARILRVNDTGPRLPGVQPR